MGEFGATERRDAPPRASLNSCPVGVVDRTSDEKETIRGEMDFNGRKGTIKLSEII
jgi:hypothetical protein